MGELSSVCRGKKNPKELFTSPPPSPLSAAFGSGLRCDGGKERSHRLWDSVRVESDG